MPTFGFSAYLKLICLNSRPQRSEIRKRLTPSEGGYDFHKSLRTFSRQFILGGVSLVDIMNSTKNIKQAPERNSTIAGLQNLVKWRAANAGEIVDCPPVTFNSPHSVYKINFKPDFGISIDGKITAVHIWNTKSPHLENRFAYGALATLPEQYVEMSAAPDDFAVLSLRDNRLLRLSDVENMSTFGWAVAAAIEGIIENELREPGARGTPTRRPPPPPPIP